MKKLAKKPVLLAVGVILVAVIVFAGLELSGKTHILRKPKAVSGVIPTQTTTGQTPESANQSGSPSPTQTANGEKSTPTGVPASSGEGPAAPTGNFVSNHHPNLDGNPAPSTIQSVCNTTPGATCTIVFKNSDITKTLESKTADSSGAVYWSWDVKQAGFTPGTWEVTATASLNNQTKSTKDTLSLEVGP